MGKPKAPLNVSIFNEESNHLVIAMNAGTPLACALIGGAFIEKALATLLHAFFIEDISTANSLLDHTGALGSVQPRADLAYSLGLIDLPMYRNICNIGTIRNRFAHSHVDMTFDDHEVEKLCNKFVPPTVNGVQGGNPVHLSNKIPVPEAQRKFCGAIWLLGVKLHDITVGLKRQPEPTPLWCMNTPTKDHKETT